MSQESIYNFFSGYSSDEAAEMLVCITDAAMQSEMLDAEQRADVIMFKNKLIVMIKAAEGQFIKCGRMRGD